jgi:hypothetical protein
LKLKITFLVEVVGLLTWAAIAANKDGRNAEQNSSKSNDNIDLSQIEKKEKRWRTTPVVERTRSAGLDNLSGVQDGMGAGCGWSFWFEVMRFLLWK